MEKMTAKDIDNYILACPYFGGKDTIDRKYIDGTYVHVGSCGVNFNYDKICPSEKCPCAKHLGMI